MHTLSILSHEAHYFFNLAFPVKSTTDIACERFSLKNIIHKILSLEGLLQLLHGRIIHLGRWMFNWWKRLRIFWQKDLRWQTFLSEQLALMFLSKVGAWIQILHRSPFSLLNHTPLLPLCPSLNMYKEDISFTSPIFHLWWSSIA